MAFTVRPTDVEELDRGDPGGGGARERAAQGARGAEAWRRGRRPRRSWCWAATRWSRWTARSTASPATSATRARRCGRSSGATHEVLSGLALLSGDAPEPERTAVVRTAVSFRELDEGMLDWYLARGRVARTRGRLRDPGGRRGAGQKGGGRLRERRRPAAGGAARYLPRASFRLQISWQPYRRFERRSLHCPAGTARRWRTAHGAWRQKRCWTISDRSDVTVHHL